KETLLEGIREKMRFTAQFRQVSDGSFYNRRERISREFQPMAALENREELKGGIADFVPKPLYTRHELQDFRRKNMREGKFVAEAKTVQTLEDLEKLLFLWQEETEMTAKKEKVTLGEEIRTKEGFQFSGLTIEEEYHA
ncbi:MAG: DUF5716 family protein, partial [Lachnospiraceae bacterium]|nr:DUF5716 family protein [Lachnospiraceae bacterium]